MHHVAARVGGMQTVPPQARVLAMAVRCFAGGDVAVALPRLQAHGLPPLQLLAERVADATRLVGGCAGA